LFEQKYVKHGQGCVWILKSERYECEDEAGEEYIAEGAWCRDGTFVRARGPSSEKRIVCNPLGPENYREVQLSSIVAIIVFVLMVMRCVKWALKHSGKGSKKIKEEGKLNFKLLTGRGEGTKDYIRWTPASGGGFSRTKKSSSNENNTAQNKMVYVVVTLENVDFDKLKVNDMVKKHLTKALKGYFADRAKVYESMVTIDLTQGQGRFTVMTTTIVCPRMQMDMIWKAIEVPFKHVVPKLELMHILETLPGFKYVKIRENDNLFLKSIECHRSDQANLGRQKNH
jgi:hypothetical protein